MANLKNITAEPLKVDTGPGGVQRVIDPGESVDVSDYLLAEHVWPASTWQITGTKVVELAEGDDAYRAPAPGEPAPEPTLADLKDQAAALGLPVSGTEAELTDRIEQHTATGIEE